MPFVRARGLRHFPDDDLDFRVGVSMPFVRARGLRQDSQGPENCGQGVSMPFVRARGLRPWLAEYPLSTEKTASSGAGLPEAPRNRRAAEPGLSRQRLFAFPNPSLRPTCDLCLNPPGDLAVDPLQARLTFSRHELTIGT